MFSRGLLLLLSACTAKIELPPKQVPPASVACVNGVDPGPLLMRRLTNDEYLRSVNWLLTTDASPLVATFPADLRRTGFDNAFELQTVSVSHANAYFSTAKTLSDRLFADSTRTAALLGCDPSGAKRESCLRSFITTFGRRAWRRPLTTAEVDALFTLTATEAQPLDGAALALRAMLQSPKFLWRVELGQSEAGHPYLKLSGLEVASRLSFFLWGGPPDDALLDAAVNGELDTAEGVEAKARAMLDDPRSKSSFQRFIDQWFGFERIAGLSRTAATFPNFDDAMKSSMAEEVHRLFDRYLWQDGENLLDVYNTRQGFADDRLATLYGKTLAQPGSWNTLDWAGDANRGGLFTTAGLLAVTTRNDFTSPIQRGLYVRDTVLCNKPNLPPSGVPQLSMMPGENLANAENRHTSDPACSGCHKLIDPVGKGLERYDAIGQLRSSYPDGTPVAQSGRVEGLDDPDYSGGVELGERLRAAPDSVTCAVKHSFRWTMARKENTPDASDACALEQLAQRFQDHGGSFRELVLAFVTNDAFRYRRPAD